jgi:phosphohistidine phosphatase
MYLYFFRHGQADWPGWNQADDKRPLTGRGRKEIGKIARFLEKLEIELDQIISSPLPRAQQTAAIVADRLKLKLRIDPILEPGFDTAELRRLLRKYWADHIMIVGHEPDFSSVLSDLTGASLKLSKAGLALVELDDKGNSGRLLWLFPPKIPKTGLR